MYLRLDNLPADLIEEWQEPEVIEGGYASRTPNTGNRVYEFDARLNYFEGIPVDTV